MNPSSALRPTARKVIERGSPNAEPVTLMIANQEIDLWVPAGKATGPYEH
jgi:hypothetical protein